MTPDEHRADLATQHEDAAVEARGTGRKARLGYIGQVVGREVESTNDLTVAEASRVIDALNTDAAERNTEGPSA